MDIWAHFDVLERDRRERHRQHEEAFRRLDLGARDASARLAWERYREAARSHDACVVLIEDAIWKLNR